MAQVPALLFDHNETIDKLTMPDLQQLYETILNQALDRRNFQKWMLGYNILERLEGRKAGRAHKAPCYYRFDKET